MLGTRSEDTPHVPLIVVRVQAATNEVDRFVQDYCRYFGADVLFLPTEGVQPPGRRVRFFFALADDREVVCGEGVVLRMRRDSGNPQRPPGMELRYQVLDEDSQQVVDRMLALRTGITQRPRPPEPPPYVWMSVAPPPTEKVPTLVAETPRGPARRTRVVPANPFADVTDRALGFFVEEAFERMTMPIVRWQRSASVFLAGLVIGVLAMVALPARRQELRGRRLSAARALVVTPESAPRPTEVKRDPKPLQQVPAAPDPDPAPLEIHSSPPGASVFLDERLRGHTPLTIGVTPGPHRLELDRPRYVRARVEVRSPGRVVVPLERPPATLRVLSTPTGAEVRLRGRSLGVTPLDLPTAGYETYELEIVHEGHTRRRRVYLKPPLDTVEVAFR
jgi:hypothetical protein